LPFAYFHVKASIIDRAKGLGDKRRTMKSQRPVSEIVWGMFLVAFFVVVASSFCPLFSSSALANSPRRLYDQARKEYRSLMSVSEKRWNREAWNQCIHKFQQVIQKDSRETYVDKCYYLLGRSHHALYKAYQQSQDFESALKYYRKLVYERPESSLADDAQYLMGSLYLERDAALAYPEFVKVTVLFPNGDMASRAAKQVIQLEKRLGCKPDARPKSTVVKKSAESTSRPLQASVLATLSNKETPSAGSAPAMSSPKSSRVKQLEDIRYWTNEDYTRIAIYVNGPVKFDYDTLSADPKVQRPPRIYLDLKNCVVGPKLKEKARIAVKDGFLRNIRAGQFKPKRARVVLDIESIDKFKVFSLPDPFRVLIDIRGKRSQVAEVEQKLQPKEPKVTPKAELKPKAKPQLEEALDEIPSLPHFAQKLSLDVKRIMIDPGHGGKDPGAVGPKGIREKDVVLGIAKNLKRILESRVGIEVLLTRTRDQYLSLEERTAIANTKKADLFISLHTNAHKNSNIYGTETYYLNVANDAESARVAAFENAVSAEKISDLEAILNDLLTNTKITESSQLAHRVQGRMIDELTGNYEGIRDLGVKHGPFYVLLGAEMPCILIEAAFISNNKEEQRLGNENFQKALAKGIARGIESYIQDMKQIALKAGYEK
jgi:N-acetylmuramoyl-L-alanine amidase